MDRFHSKIIKDPKSGCWIWQGGKARNGSGTFYYNLKYQLAHRVSYQMYIGPIPPKAVVHRSCDNRACCNPEHLTLDEIVTEGSRRCTNYTDSRRVCAWKGAVYQPLKAFTRGNKEFASCNSCAERQQIKKHQNKIIKPVETTKIDKKLIDSLNAGNNIADIIAAAQGVGFNMSECEVKDGLVYLYQDPDLWDDLIMVMPSIKTVKDSFRYKVIN